MRIIQCTTQTMPTLYKTHNSTQTDFTFAA